MEWRESVRAGRQPQDSQLQVDPEWLAALLQAENSAREDLSFTFTEEFMAARRNATALQLFAAKDTKKDKELVQIYDNVNLPPQQRTEALAKLLMSYRTWLKTKTTTKIQ